MKHRVAAKPGEGWGYGLFRRVDGGGPETGCVAIERAWIDYAPGAGNDLQRVELILLSEGVAFPLRHPHGSPEG